MRMFHIIRTEYPKGTLIGPAVNVEEYIPGDQVIGVLRNRRGHVYAGTLSTLFFLRDGAVDEIPLDPIRTTPAWASAIAKALDITLTKVDVSLDTNYQYARLNLDLMVAAAVGGTYQHLYFPTDGSRRLGSLRYTGRPLLLPPERFVILPVDLEETSLVVMRSAITSIRRREARTILVVAGHEFRISLTLNGLVNRLGGAVGISIPE